MPKLMKEKETAAMVGMSVHWLRKKRWEGGGIPFVKLSERGAVRYSEETVLQYIETHFRISTSDTGEHPRGQPAAEEMGRGL
jgi:hypothetical protein